MRVPANEIDDWLDEADLEEEGYADDAPTLLDPRSWDETERTPTLSLGSLPASPGSLEATRVEPRAAPPSIPPVALSLAAPARRATAPSRSRAALVALAAMALAFQLAPFGGAQVARSQLAAARLDALVAGAVASAPAAARAAPRAAVAPAPAATDALPIDALPIDALPLASAPAPPTVPAPPRAAAERAPSTSSSDQGVLHVTALAPASVVVDGQPVGKTPRSVRVGPGTHTVVILGKLGRNLQVVRVPAGAERTVRFGY